MLRGSHVRFIRPPFGYRFNDVDVREEPIITFATGFLEAAGFYDFSVYDFNLDRQLKYNDVIGPTGTLYVISVRETGEQVHYVKRLVAGLLADTEARIYLYGQTARLQAIFQPSERLFIVRHSERELASALQLNIEGLAYETGLHARPYFHELKLEGWQLRRFRANIESTRGCHYPCQFCFINSGNNYEKRWQVRPIEAVIADIRAYYEKGIRQFAIHDSEFLGADQRQYASREALLEEIAERFPNIQLMLYCRADTLLRFDRFALLARAGVVNVFIGVESFDQQTLDILNKRILVSDIICCIEKLLSHSIHCQLSFIVFNRSTSVGTLRENLEKMSKLLLLGGRYLGLPNFTFSFEASWSDEQLTPVPVAGYMRQDYAMKCQPGGVGTVYNADLGPVVELCRLLAYEWSRKVVELNHTRDSSDLSDQLIINEWFNELPRRCIALQTWILDEFEANRLSFESLIDYRDEMFTRLAIYYRYLPVPLSRLATYELHARALQDAESAIVEADEYWTAYIPGFENEMGHFGLDVTC